MRIEIAFEAPYLMGVVYPIREVALHGVTELFSLFDTITARRQSSVTSITWPFPLDAI
jgi:hypothetical protein